MADFGQTDLAKPTLASSLTDFGQTLCFSVLAKFSEPKKPKPQRPKNLYSDLNPKPYRPKPKTGGEGARQFGPTLRDPTLRGPFAPHPLRGHTSSGFGLHPPFLAVLVLLWLWLLWLLLVWIPLDHPAPDHPPPDLPFRRTAQNFALFFSLPLPFRFFSVSLGVFSLNFGGVFEGWRFWAARVSHDNPRTPNVHISAPRRFKHHQNSTGRHPERRKKSEMVAGEGKNKRYFGPPTLPGPTLRGPTFFWVWRPHPSKPHFSGFGGPTLRGPEVVVLLCFFSHLVVLIFF